MTSEPAGNWDDRGRVSTARVLPFRRRRDTSVEPVARADDGASLRTFLYDADGRDRDVALPSVSVDQLTDRQLLWIDISTLEDIDSSTAALGLAGETVARIGAPSSEPGLFVHDGYVHIVAVAPRRGNVSHEPHLLHCVVGANWVLTAHQDPIGFLDHFDDRIRGDSDLGMINSHDFLAAILEELVTSYFGELGPIEATLDQLDVRVLTGRVEEEALLRELIALRVRLARLRRLLTPHRELFGVMTRTEFRVLAGTESTANFDGLTEVLERAFQSMEATREMIVGSFDIYTTWTAHGANKVMKLLTVVSVTLLPPTLLAGVMGMNSLPGGLAQSVVFWITTSVMIGLAVATLTFARVRHWI